MLRRVGEIASEALRLFVDRVAVLKGVVLVVLTLEDCTKSLCRQVVVVELLVSRTPGVMAWSVKTTLSCVNKGFW